MSEISLGFAAGVSALEALLFVSGEPLSLARIEKILRFSEGDVRAAANQLREKYIADETSGLMLVEHDRRLMLATKLQNAPYLEALSKSAFQESLSKVALEVLSIIAYRAPITRAEIDSIRGVNCSFTLRNLLLRDLIERSGNPEDSRGYIYRPSFKFLQTLGLSGVQELPDYETLSQDERLKFLETDELLSEHQNDHHRVV